MSRTCLAVLLLAVSCRRAEKPPQAVALPVDTSLGVAASDSEAVAAARFTQAFYDWYAAHNQNLDTAIAKKPTVFAPQLLEELRADLAASAKSPDEVVGLDWDPFTNTQDPCNPYSVGRVTRRADTLLIAVSGSCDIAQPAVLAELRRSGSDWQFVDLRHVGEAGSLLGDLAKLREERKETRKRR